MGGCLSLFFNKPKFTGVGVKLSTTHNNPTCNTKRDQLIDYYNNLEKKNKKWKTEKRSIDKEHLQFINDLNS